MDITLSHTKRLVADEIQSARNKVKSKFERYEKKILQNYNIQ